MSEIETTERYEYRTSNLMHSYYAANSVDGRSTGLVIPSENKLMTYLNKQIAQVRLFLASLINFSWKGFAPNISIPVGPKVRVTPAYLIVNPNYANRPAANNGIHPPTNRPNVCNTTHKWGLHLLNFQWRLCWSVWCGEEQKTQER